MTIDEILQRIVRGHLNTILICLLVPFVVVLLVQIGTPVTYQAEVRLQTLSAAPQSATQAEGLSSRVLALATTPQVVQSALKAADQPASGDDAVEVATQRVSAERLGVSPVVVLSVTAEDADAAALIVSKLAGEVVAFMNDGGRAQFEETLADVRTRHTEALEKRDGLQTDLLRTDGLQARANLEVLLAAAQRDLDQARSELSALTLADADRDYVVAVDRGQPTVERVPSTLLPRAALALLLGLLVGVAVAVLQETLRPRVAGIRELARVLDAPILGSTTQPAQLEGSLNLAARRQGVETMVLVGVDEKDEKLVHQLLESLHSEWRDPPVESTPMAAARRAMAPESSPEEPFERDSQPAMTMSSRVRFTERYGVRTAEEPTAGVVVVSAGSPARSSLDHLEDMVRAMRWPVVGVVDASSRRGRLTRP